MKKKHIWMITAAISLCLAGCAQTPEESPVASKAGGLPKESIVEALPEGESRELDMPAHWTQILEKGDGQVRVEADLDIDVPQVGNIPVIELEQKVLTDEMLERLCVYFGEDKMLYHPGALSKKQLMQEYDRMKAKEGAYGNPYQISNLGSVMSSLEEKIESATEEEGAPEKAEPRFGPKWLWEKDFIYGSQPENTEHGEDFKAWVDCGRGVENDPIITARSKGFIKKVSSMLQIEKGGFLYEASDVLDEKLLKGEDLEALQEIIQSGSQGVAKGFQEYVKKLEKAFSEPVISREKAMEAADKAMEDLNIQGLSFSRASRALIVPRDGRWEGIGADLSRAETGYSLLYFRSVEGLDGCYQKNFTIYDGLPETSYAPSFQQEFVLVTVGAEGICRFRWENPASEVSTVADNVKLIPFEKAAERLADHLLYVKASGDELNGFESGQSSHRYEVKNVKLCMVYVNAYGNPEHVWLVPAWVFETQWYLNHQGHKEVKRETNECMIGAIDGGYISPY